MNRTSLLILLITFFLPGCNVIDNFILPAPAPDLYGLQIIRPINFQDYYNEADEGIVELEIRYQIIGTYAKEDIKLDLIFGGTATEGIDYKILTGKSITIPKGNYSSISRKVRIQILNDSTDEQAVENIDIVVVNKKGLFKPNDNYQFDSIKIKDSFGTSPYAVEKIWIGFEKQGGTHIEGDTIPLKILLEKPLPDDIVLKVGNRNIIIYAGEKEKVMKLIIVNGRINRPEDEESIIRIFPNESERSLYYIDSKREFYKIKVIDADLGLNFSLEYQTNIPGFGFNRFIEMLISDSEAKQKYWTYGNGNIHFSRYLPDGVYFCNLRIPLSEGESIDGSVTIKHTFMKLENIQYKFHFTTEPNVGENKKFLKITKKGDDYQIEQLSGM